MPHLHLSQNQIREAHDANLKYGSQVKASQKLGISRGALQARLARARPPGPISGPRDANEELTVANREIDKLQTALASAVKDLSALSGLAGDARAVTPPTWTTDITPKARRSPGCPVALWSDWHWAEVVDPAQVNGVNKYNLKIAKERARTLVSTTIDLLKNHIANPSYPGIVLCLGGDMLSGDIHDELKQTNEIPTYPAVLDLLAVLEWAVTQLADAFGRVHIPVVYGNHGRMSHKPVAKMAAHQNTDWLIGRLLQMKFADDPRVTFQVSDSSDVIFRVFNLTTLLTHGNQFYGGSGIAGMLSPLMLGDARKRKRQVAVNQSYDLMIMGHWHQLFHGRGLIVNGSLKGYDEYAFQGNFDYEIARQALWVVHPTHGLNWWMPVNVQEPAACKTAPWLAVPA